MKITIKTVKGSSFQLDAEAATTVLSLKEQIEALHPETYPKGSQTLVHKGKILKDDTSVGDNGISEEGFVVVMAQPKKAAAASPAAPQTSAAASASVSSAPAPAAAPAADAPRAMDTSAPAAPAPAAAGGDAFSSASSLLSGGALESAVSQICDMGFPREEVMRAMRAAFNNPERAVEYLTMGMPAGAEVAAAAPAPGAAVGAPGVPAAAAAALAAAAAPAAAGPTAQPFNMFGGPGAAAAGGAGAAPAAAGPLDFLRNLPQFQHIRQAVQANPQILVPMLQEMGKSNPELLALINSHQQEFLRLIMEQPSDQEMAAMQEAAAAAALEGMMGAGGGAVVELTQEDEEAVNRLQGLGFDRGLCIEAYLACDKNENLAANYLFDNGGEM